MLLTVYVQINTLEEPFLNVNCMHLKQFNPELYSQLVRYPQEVIPAFDLATNEVFSELYPDTVLEHQIQVWVDPLPQPGTGRGRGTGTGTGKGGGG